MFPDILHPKTYVSLAILCLVFIVSLVINNGFLTDLFVLLFVFSSLATAWNIVGGFAGQLSLGHAAFYGVGGYTSFLLTLNFGISPWVGMLAGAFLSAALAIIISVPTLRLKGPFFALASIAILEVVRVLVIHESSWTEGSTGISLPLNIGWSWMVFRNKANYIILSFGIFIFVLWVSWLIRRSRMGHYLIAIRERDNAARAVGINTSKMKVIAFVISAVLTSIVGTFHTTYLTFIDPESAFSLDLSIQIAMFALIGGMGTVIGPVAGVFLVLPVAELARAWLSGVGNGLHGLIYGIILVLVVLTIPRGLVGVFGERIEKIVMKLPYLGKKKDLTKGERNADETFNDPDKHLAPSQEYALRAKNLFKSFGGLKATNNVSIDLYKNEILGIIGPNGAGKTTVFNQLSGFLRPDSGTVSIVSNSGEWTNCNSPYEYAHNGLARTFQVVQPFAGLSVIENIMLGAFIHTTDRDKAQEIAKAVAQDTGLEDQLNFQAGRLSVGGMKRLEVARALATRPHILLLDEVVAGLNPSDIDKAITMIKNIRNSGVSIIIIEHMMQAIMALSDRVIVINEGQLLISGTPKDVVNDPKVIEAYLGKDYEHA